MTNINIEIPDELHKKVKIRCAVDETTVKDFVIKAIENQVEEPKPPKKAK
ncbi:hypothetical protein JW930_02475 [Candidatus Woesearchaeota archaeon]|nr:hypothetical protein [Candidatus Woesearchaeota archaeon]